MYNDKNLTCADCGRSSCSPPVSRTSTLSAGSPSPVGVRRAAPAARLPVVQMVVAVVAATAATVPAAATAPVAAVDMAAAGAGAATTATVARARCSAPRARPAAARPRSPSARRAASPFIALTASAASAADPATKPVLSERPIEGPPKQRDPDPGCQPTRVARFPHDFWLSRMDNRDRVAARAPRSRT